MLLSLKIKNFLSFKEEVVLDLNASSIKDLEETNVAIADFNAQRVLKSLVIYGANSSGKSNSLNALIFIKRFVMHSFRNNQLDEIAGVESFLLNSRTESKPSSFEIVFIVDRIKYRYTITVDRNEVHNEELHYTKVNKEYFYFKRNKNQYEIDEDKFVEGLNVTDKTRSNALFLSVVAQFNGTISKSIVKWFTELKYFSDLNKPQMQNHTVKLLDNDRYSSLILRFLNYINLGFDKVKVEKINVEGLDFLKELLKENKQSTTIIKTEHIKYDENGMPDGIVLLNLNKNESLGSQKLFALAGLIIESLVTGRVIIIDELDARLHPLLTLGIIKLFNSKNNNPRNAQLIFATHGTTVLTNKNFRRDQIYLAEKDKFGATSLKTLKTLDEKKVRIDESFDRNYLSGNYGSVPDLKEDFKLFENYLN